MSFSLNEVDAMGKKAARGAGFDWGVAEEAGRAARWLCANGIDGVAALAAALSRADGADPLTRAPVSLDGDWRAESGELCPLMAGAALGDAATLWAGTGKRLRRIAAPVLLLPFAALAARRLGGPVTLEWAGARAVTDGRALHVAGAARAVMAARAEAVAASAGGALANPGPMLTRATPDRADWAALSALAQRTYAPRTEQSRLLGAGAGLTDND